MTQSDILEKINNTSHTILITGKTGTGKTYLAESIHKTSNRAEKKFFSINLATLNENLIESELFGHEKGAFSGADCRRMGKLESANGGTVLLDEIGELPLRIQTKLLDTLNHKSITPVGSNRAITLDVRILAATNRNLEEMVRNGSFREDLYFRINTFQLELPDLQSTPEKLVPFARELTQKSALEQGKNIELLSDSFLNMVKNYSWPGNIREFKNAIDFAVAMTCDGNLDSNHLPPYILKKIQHKAPTAEALQFNFPINYQESKAYFEKMYIETMLTRFEGKINVTSRNTHLSKVTLIDKIRRYGIDVNAIKFQKYLNQ